MGVAADGTGRAESKTSRYYPYLFRHDVVQQIVLAQQVVAMTYHEVACRRVLSSGKAAEAVARVVEIAGLSRLVAQSTAPILARQKDVILQCLLVKLPFLHSQELWRFLCQAAAVWHGRDNS